MKKSLLVLLGSSVLILTVALHADVTPAMSSGNSDAALIAKEESIRRQAAQVQAQGLIEEGCKLIKQGKAEAAIPKLDEARTILPRSKSAENDSNRATHALSDAYLQLANSALKVKDNQKAIELAKKSLEYAPDNRSAEYVIVKAKRVESAAPVPVKVPAPDKTPAFLTQRDQVKKLFREGKILLSSGQYDEAERRFQQILLIDPYNADAQEMLRMVSVSREPSTRNGAAASRTRMIWQADNAWLLPTGGEVKRPEEESSATRLQSTAINQSIIQKLNSIKFPQINFREASLVDVITHLSEQSRKLDPTGEGVNFVFGPGVEATTAAPAAAEGGAAPAPAATGNTASRSISLNVNNIPMIDALKYITKAAGLKYRVESSAVVLLPPDAPTEEMITKTYAVSPGVFTKYAGAPAADAAGGGGGIEKMGSGNSTAVTTIDLQVVFKGAGVDFPAGSSITYNDRTSKVIIRNTPENIENFEKILPSFDERPSQVEIEAKFIDIAQTDLDELGFQWGVGQYSTGSFGLSGAGGTLTGGGGSTLNNVTGGLRNDSSIPGNPLSTLIGGAAAASPQLFALNGILTNPQFQMTLSALAQKQSTDVLEAPKVTTISGQAATIKVVQEFIYPSDYTAPQVSAGSSGGNAAITPSVPSAWKTKEVGVVLNVTPTVSADKYTIDLALSPQTTDFLGFIDYSPGNVVSGNETVPFKIQMPLFATRQITTRVNIWDGQTVVLGGLIKENVQKIDDKVPFLGDLPILGRLFQSKVTNKQKQNLLVFVTVRLIGPDGTPIHRDVGRGGAR